MPRVPIDFSKTIIYKIVHKEDPDNHDTYVGHTTEFAKRKCEHKRRCENPSDKKHHYKVYQYIRENGGWDNFIMLEIEKYPCNDGNEARARENYWYNELKSKLNTRVPSRTLKQYYHDNREKILENKKQHYQDNRDEYLEYQKQYRQDNRDKISEYNKQYNQDNREKISEQRKQYYQDNRDKFLEKQKQYQQDNHDEYLENMKQYYQDNREKILENIKQKITCEICGFIGTKHHLKRHQKTKKCMDAKK